MFYLEKTTQNSGKAKLYFIGSEGVDTQVQHHAKEGNHYDVL